MPPHFDLAIHHRLQEIAASTLKALAKGSYDVNGAHYNLAPSIEALRAATELFPDASPSLTAWKDQPSPEPAHNTQIIFSHASTLIASRRYASAFTSADTATTARVGLLNFASAETPGGGFEHGAQAQEESLARSSTLHTSLTSSHGAPFYQSHFTEPQGLYRNAMIWSPKVSFFRTDDGKWTAPFEADVLTSPAVNAFEVRLRLRVSGKGGEVDANALIESTMRERMARILRLFELKGSQTIVLGSFGTGAFGNDVGTIARIWAELLGKGGRFEKSFAVVDFAIIDEGTLGTFKGEFQRKANEIK